MVNLTINGIEVQVPKGTTILEACRMNGIDVPTLCYDEDLKTTRILPDVHCRV